MKVGRELPRGEKKAVYVDGKLYEILEGFTRAVEKHNTSVVLVCDGRSGMGKTTIANQIAIILDPDYGLHKIHYNPETFLEGLLKAKKGDCLVFDEAMLISSRSALSEINRMIIQAMSMIRSKNIYVIFCVNSIFDLDRNLAISRADLLLHVYGDSLVDRGRFTAFFRGKDGTDRLKLLYLMGKKLYEYNKPKSNFYGSFTKEFVVDEKLYEVQKQKGIDIFLKGDTGRKTKAMIHRDNLLVHLHTKENFSAEKLADITEMSVSGIYKVLKMREEQGKTR